jgi:hypothetical protein
LNTISIIVATERKQKKRGRSKNERNEGTNEQKK